MLRSPPEIKGPVRAIIGPLLRLIPLAIVCALFGALLADLSLRGETAALRVALVVLAGLAWVAYELVGEVVR